MTAKVAKLRGAFLVRFLSTRWGDQLIFSDLRAKALIGPRVYTAPATCQTISKAQLAAIMAISYHRGLE